MVRIIGTQPEPQGERAVTFTVGRLNDGAFRDELAFIADRYELDLSVRRRRRFLTTHLAVTVRGGESGLALFDRWAREQVWRHHMPGSPG